MSTPTGRSFSIDAANSEFPGFDRGRRPRRRPRVVRRRPARRPAVDPDHHRPDRSRDDDPLFPSSCVRGPSERRHSPRQPRLVCTTTPSPGAPVFEPVDFFTDLFTPGQRRSARPRQSAQRVVAGSPADAFVDLSLRVRAARVDSRQGPLEPFTVTERTTADRRRARPSTSAAKGSATRSAASSSTRWPAAVVPAQRRSPSTTAWPRRRRRPSSDRRLGRRRRRLRAGHGRRARRRHRRRSRPARSSTVAWDEVRLRRSVRRRASRSICRHPPTPRVIAPGRSSSRRSSCSSRPPNSAASWC